MSQFFRSLAVLAGFLASIAGFTTAQAATTTSTFQVAVDLTPHCFVNINTATPASQATTNIALSYVAFQATDAEASTGFTVRCSNTLPFSIAVSPDTNSAAGITYFLRVAAGTTPAFTSTTGSGSLAAQTGSGVDQDYSIGARALAGQAGTCATTGGCSVNSTNHTITITY